MLRAGQKVVCVNARLPWLGHVLRILFRAPWPLQEGAVYTIHRLAVVYDENGVELVEVKNTRHLEYCFRASRFRPLVETKTDISVFTKMLTPKKEPVHAQ